MSTWHRVAGNYSHTVNIEIHQKCYLHSLFDNKPVAFAMPILYSSKFRLQIICLNSEF